MIKPDTGKTERYLKYEPARDVLFVLGAGASYADGVPLQKDILPLLLSDQRDAITVSAIGRQVRHFISDNFYVSSGERIYPKLEAVFGFLDHFILCHESLSAAYNLNRLVRIRENLIKIIHYIVDLRTEEHSSVYQGLWEAIRRHNRNISIITLNYDTLLEQAFSPLFPHSALIDYGIYLMNYEKRKGLEDHNFWINPREPVQVGLRDDPIPIKILKLHGSLNWKYCNCCNQVLLTPWDRKIDLNRGRFIGYTYPDKQAYDYFCPLDGTEFNTLIVPPSYLKSWNNPVLSQLFSEASREIRAARRIVFIGYSLSDYDVHVRALFKKHLDPKTPITVVNPRKSEALKQQYFALSRQVRFVPHSFEELIQDQQLMAELLS